MPSGGSPQVSASGIYLIPSELAEVNGELHVARWRVSVAGKTTAQRGMTQAGDASGSGLGGLHSWDI